MKVIIIDDESYVVDTIELLVDWERFHITQRFVANTVQTAIGILDREKPDLAFVDVVLDDRLGSEILAYINSKNLPTKSIVISGHDTYNYIRAMFLLGAVDYLLKPIERDTINLAVEKAVQQIALEDVDKSGFSVDKKFKKLFPDHQHSLMRKLFQEKHFDSAYQELCRVNYTFGMATECMVFYSLGALLPMHLPEYSLRLSQFLNDVQFFLENENCGTVFQRAAPNFDICILIYRDFHTAVDHIRQAMKAFNDTPRPGLYLAFGHSARYRFPASLETAYQEAALAAQYLPLTFDNLLLPFSNDMEPLLPPVSIRMENRVFSSLLTGEKAQMSSDIHDYVAFVRENLPQTRGGAMMLSQAVLTLYRKACDYLASVFGKKVVTGGDEKRSGFAECCTGSWEETMLRIENAALLLFLDLQERNRDSTYHLSMRVVADWLELNYMKRIRQQDCARLFHFNKDYMCRRFREEYGVGMVHYLTQIRINHAKAYLQDSNLQYQEIADAVGIFDSKYFAKLFKRETGMTPTEFRNAARKNTRQ